MKLFQIAIIIILLGGVAVGLILVGNPTRFLPKAASDPIEPTPSVISGPIGSPSPSVSVSPQTMAPFYLVFVTSTNYTGALGGISGADTYCQQRATAANLGGNWRAWISNNTGSSSPHNRFIGRDFSAGYRLVDGTLLANSYADLTDGLLNHQINVTELATQKNSLVWTNTNTNGSYISEPDGQHCLNWNSSAATNSGRQGSTSRLDTAWSGMTFMSNCNMPAALYCFSNTTRTELPTQNPIPGKQTNLGDINGNGKIDIFDFNEVVTDFAKVGVFPADINKSGKVDIFDFNIVVTNFGQTISDIIKQPTFPISPPTGYKWAPQVQTDGNGNLLKKCMTRDPFGVFPQELADQIVEEPVPSGYWWTYQIESSSTGSALSGVCLEKK